MKIVRLVSLFLPLVMLVLLPRALAAQQPAPLENFVARIASLWSRADADAIVALAPADGRIQLDLIGDGPGEVQERHAAAALRGLFGERENVSVRPRQVTISGGAPVRGFGELTWLSRPRGVSDNLSSIIYVGAVWEDGAWRLRELRVLR